MWRRITLVVYGSATFQFSSNYETILFNTLTGLRPDEAQKAIYLLKIKGDEYVNKEKGLLLHYLFPKTFFRTTKKCYISVINKGILDLVKSIEFRVLLLYGKECIRQDK
jgi:hypothetical protein